MPAFMLRDESRGRYSNVIFHDAVPEPGDIIEIEKVEFVVVCRTWRLESGRSDLHLNDVVLKPVAT